MNEPTINSRRVDRKPILVTGSHRSGSTWVGQMIATSPRVGYVHEPFNVDHHPGICPMSVPYWFTYVTDENASRFQPALDRTLRFAYSPLAELRTARRPRHFARVVVDGGHFLKYRLLRCRPLLKDPLALFTTEWLASEYSMDVVLLVRHPAAFAASVRRQGYTHPFSDFLRQPQLMRDHLAPFEQEIRAIEARSPDVIDEAALLWRLTTFMTLKLQSLHPDWLFYRYEDLAQDPTEHFKRIFGKLHLKFTREIHDRIDRATNPNISGWKEDLSPEEIGALRSMVGELSDPLYADADW